MKKQLFVAAGGVVLLAVLFFLGRTTEPKKPMAAVPKATIKTFDVQQFIDSSRKRLTPSQSLLISKYENGISRGDVKEQQIRAYEGLAAFWKDSLRAFEPYAFYTAEAAKLDMSEKNLTFAARLFLENLRGEQDEAKLNWETAQAIELFEKAIAINPNNDDLRIGLGSAYIFGRGRSGDPAETMEGIQQLLGVARRDSTNMKAQLMLGIGGYISHQYDKAIERFTRVITAEPNNLEAIAFLADTYAAKGDKADAIKWYTISKRLINDPHYNQQVDERIKQLQ